MNRRNFLKRLAAVAVGSVAVPTIAKQLPFKLNPTQKEIRRTCNTVGGKYKTLHTWEFSCIGDSCDYNPPSMPSTF